jgi:hypothetical protein
MENLQTLPPGQRAILRSFARHGADSVYVPSDIMDLRVCCAMAAKGILARFEEGDLRGYELTALGRSTVAPAPSTPERP